MEVRPQITLDEYKANDCQHWQIVRQGGQGEIFPSQHDYYIA